MSASFFIKQSILSLTMCCCELRRRKKVPIPERMTTTLTSRVIWMRIPDLARLNPAVCFLAANPITYVKISCLLEAPPGPAESQPDKAIFDALVISLETKGNRLYGRYKPAIPEKA